MLPVRKHPRLKGYDYSQCGCYHITICVKQRRPILSRIIPAKNAAERPQVQLCKAGQVTEYYIQNIPDVYADVILEKYVIMPNHVHLLLSLGSGASVSIPTVIRSLKRMINREVGESIWQDSYFDTVVRSDAVYRCEWQYIDENPDKWMLDELYVHEV